MIDYVDYNSQVCEQYMNQTITLEPGSYKYFSISPFKKKKQL